MAALPTQTYSEILDNLPQVVMRLRYNGADWNVDYVNKTVERYGYNPSDFTSGKLTWNDLLHPDDEVVALKLSDDYMKSGIDNFKLQYRVQTKGGKSLYITEFSHVNRNADGTPDTIDSFLFERLESRAINSPEMDTAIQRNLALNDILLTLQDANSDPEKSIQFILDRVGEFLDCSRALLFKDSQDHKTCKVVYEWLNNGITSIKDLDYAVTYATEMPEIYIALQDTGVLLVNAGEIPENCKEEFEAEGLVSSAIFAVYQYGDHYGFVCFDDCIVERRWDDDTANFLKVVANLLSNAVMHLQSVQYMREYEEKIKSLAFRDYQTGLPNHYPYDSDLADIIFSAAGEGKPGFAAMVALDSIDSIRNSRGLAIATAVFKAVADELQPMLEAALGERATLYRITGTVFAVLAQPGPAEPVRAFAEKVSERGRRPWRVGSEDFVCPLNVAVVPFGLKNVDPEKINARLDQATVRSSSSPEHSLVFLDAEE